MIRSLFTACFVFGVIISLENFDDLRMVHGAEFESNEISIEGLGELNPFQLGERLDSLYIELAESACSPELIPKLEALIWMYHRREALSPQQFRGYENFTLLQLYAKLGYLHELAGSKELSDSHYELALQMGKELDSEYYDLDYIRELPFNSRMGCEVK